MAERFSVERGEDGHYELEVPGVGKWRAADAAEVAGQCLAWLARAETRPLAARAEGLAAALARVRAGVHGLLDELRKGAG